MNRNKNNANADARSAKQIKKSMNEAITKSGKGNRSTKRSKAYREEKESEIKSKDFGPGKNDIGWYSRYPAIYDAAANFIWSRPAGVKVPRKYQNLVSSNLTDQSNDFCTPGTLCMEVVHGIGNTHLTGTNAPVNVATKGIYTWVRHMNSGHSNYDGPDLMLYLLAMAEIYAAISFIGRAFGTVAMFSGSNRFLPEALLAQQDIDGDSLRDNYANFRARMNILIQKAASLVVPLGMDIFNRYVWLYMNYYSEGDITKDQIYFLKPKGFRKYGVDSSGAGKLEWFDLSAYYSGGKLTWGSFCLMLEDMLTPLIADEDINIMAGDLLKAYGESGIQRLTFLPEMFIATPLHNEEVLWQFKNAKMIAGTTSNYDIEQDGNHEYLIYEPETTANLAEILVNTVDTMIVTDKIPDREINMINTRLAATVDYGVVGAAPTAGHIICGSEFVTSINVAYQSGGTLSSIYIGRVYAYNAAPAIQLGLLSPFKFAPEILFSNGASLYPFTMFEVDDYTLLSRDDLMLVHDAAILSLFATPHVSM